MELHKLGRDGLIVIYRCMCKSFSNFPYEAQQVLVARFNGYHYDDVADERFVRVEDIKLIEDRFFQKWLSYIDDGSEEGERLVS